MTTLGILDWQPADPLLLAPPVAAALLHWPSAAQVRTAEIDPELADTAAFCERYEVAIEDSVNCVIIAGRRGEVVRYAACLVQATRRADVNGVVRQLLDARKASFAPMTDAVARSGMEYGGITPLGLPAEWRILIDAEVLQRGDVVIGSGLRRSKIALPALSLAELPQSEVVSGLSQS